MGGPCPPSGCETELNLSVICLVLKATANDRRQLALATINFVGLDLAFVNGVFISALLVVDTTTNKTAAFGVKLIHKCMSKHRYIQKTDCLVRFMGWWNPYSKTMKALTLINGDRYRAMITNSFIPELNNHDAQELWSQQDGATCHTARSTMDLLKDTFGVRPNFTFWTCELASKIL
ncbi:hypothetical protein TNCV_520811 [Trichonephila clavipes]|nr:hypothetical protein TNCV_520811 [Trichonephila clavipes]